MIKFNTEAAMLSIQATCKAAQRLATIREDYAIWNQLDDRAVKQGLDEDYCAKTALHMLNFIDCMEAINHYIQTGLVDPLLLESMLRAAEMALYMLTTEGQPKVKFH